MESSLEPSWKKILTEELDKPYFAQLMIEVQADYLLNDPPVFPLAEDVFNAFLYSPFDDVTVVILGQDPYHGPGQAHGLSFSVQDGVKVPPSLRNIYKELREDVGKSIPESGNLEHWAKQGVLLLNATMTVLQAKPGSHQGKGWEQFTDSVIKTISDHKEHVVFLLWGNFARSKAALIDAERHLILEAPHPSPFSAHTGFFGSHHFSTCNEYLKANNLPQIKW